MKKILLMAIVLLCSGTLLAQGTKVKADSRSFIAFHGGPSIPIAGFGSTGMSNSNAGFAKTGYHFNLSYGYAVNKGMGLAAGMFFNRNNINGAFLNITDPETHQVIPVSMDHWQFYGISVGPMYSFSIGKKAMIDLKAMGGIVNANAPMIKVMGMNVTNDEWGMAAILQGGADCRIDVSKRLFLMASADYSYLDPKFKYTYTSVVEGQLTAEDFHQKMTMVNITAGIGFKF